MEVQPSFTCLQEKHKQTNNI